MNLHDAARAALNAMQSFEGGTNGLYEGEFAEEIAALKAALAEPVQERKPLMEEEIYEMYNEPRSDAEMVAFARAIELAHGIGEKE